MFVHLIKLVVPLVDCWHLIQNRLVTLLRLMIIRRSAVFSFAGCFVLNLNSQWPRSSSHSDVPPSFHVDRSVNSAYASYVCVRVCVPVHSSVVVFIVSFHNRNNRFVRTEFFDVRARRRSFSVTMWKYSDRWVFESVSVYYHVRDTTVNVTI